MSEARPPAPEEEHTPTASILAFSAPVLGVFVGLALTSMYLLKFATDVLLVSPAVMGAILLLGRIWDAVSDPLVGQLSDRTHTRLGRRRPWFLASAFPLGLAVIALWSPPRGLEGGALTVWLSASFLLFYTFFTTFRVPHLALAAELSRGYHDRTRVFGLMQAMESLGFLGAAGAVFWLEASDDPRSAAMGLSWAIAIACVVLILFTTSVVRERPEFQGRGSPSSRKAFGDVFTNPHARILVVVFFLEQLGFAVLAVLLPFLSDYVLETPGMTGVYLGAALVSMLVSIPLWLVAARRFGKKRVWVFAMLGRIVACAALFFIESGEFGYTIGAIAIFGVMTGCGSVVGPSLKADVVDWDESRTGERKEGAYFATWNFAQKTAGGVAGWLVGSVLALTGFEPNAVQGEDTLMGLRLLVSAWPAVLQSAALLGLLRFSLDEAGFHRAQAEAATAGTRRG